MTITPAPVSSAVGRRATGVAIALGAGGARGLAHLVALEALDELGVRPVAIAGSSIGAIIGAAYAAGMPARALRSFVLASFRLRPRVVAKLLEARVGKISALISRSGIGNPVLVDGERILDLFWPEAVPDRFEGLRIPFTVIATDYHLRSEVTFQSGPLTPAVGASMAIPGLVRPVVIGDQVLIDGGAINPLPYADLMGAGTFVIAVDVCGAAFVSEARVPEPVEAMFGASQILMSALVQRMLERQPPDLMVRPHVGSFAGLDFFKSQDILAAAEPIKEQIKRSLESALGR
ncbi:MAG: patatin-like phospholipase family protein [Hyphomicrobiales bacterium]|jgi:NTE family protein|nr:patatin-like phospholipase family protein [Hyphomicrobiales bacterium]